jgi:MFS family permease
VWDALRMKNTIQVIGLVAYNVGLLLYGAVQIEQIKEAIFSLAEEEFVHKQIWSDTMPFLIAIPSIIAVATIALGFISWKLYDEFAWTIYKRISADLRMKRRYLQYQVYIALLKFDFFFFLGFTVQFVVIVTQRKTEFALTIAAIPVTILILLAAAWFVRKEILTGTIAVIVSLCFLSPPNSTSMLTNPSPDPLLRRSSILHLQDGAHVQLITRRGIQTRQKGTHHLRSAHHHLHPPHHHQCMHVRAQLQQRVETVRQPANRADRRRREAHPYGQ